MSPTTTCSNCGRVTPSRHQKCVYCATPLMPETQAMYEEPRVLGGKARFRRRSDDRLHCLVLPAGDPVELSPGKLFVLGRDPRASLVVRVEDVSRQHAEIDWDDEDPPRPLLVEIRSQQGTFLNNRRLQSGERLPIRSGDEIRLGESFQLRYLHMSERERRQELETLGSSDTRSFRRRPAAAPTPAAPAIPSLQRQPRYDDLVSAALGETNLSEDMDGSFAQTPGRVLVKRLHSQRLTGVLTVYDGRAVGEVVLIEGRCRKALLGVLEDRKALERVARLDAGHFRFRPEDRGLLERAPPPADVDEFGLALSGDLARASGSEVMRDLIHRKVSGVLTIFEGTMSGQAVLEHGICQEVRLGEESDREALDAIVRLDHGVYRFRPGPVRSHEPRRAAPPVRLSRTDLYEPVPYAEPEPAYGEPDPYAAPPSYRTPSGRQPAARGPLRPADSSEGVARRSGIPVRPPARKSRPAVTRRQRPPLPTKRRKPPPPRPH